MSKYPMTDLALHCEGQLYLSQTTRPALGVVQHGVAQPCCSLSALDGYFNLTMSYGRDSDNFKPCGWLKPPVQTQANLSAGTELVA